MTFDNEISTFVNEIFYFYPQKFGYNPSTIDEVYLVGEFNDWGKDVKKLEEYKLVKDKIRWIGLFQVPKGREAYKFLLNKNTYCPDMGHLYYSTLSTPQWARKAIWYQIMVDRFYNADNTLPTPNLISWDSPPDYFNNFGGDLKGIKEKIPYFKKLFGKLENVAFYLNPINKSLASNHKYWPEDFESIDPQFGSEDDLKALIDSMHNEGARLIIDLVYNHTGINHHAFMDILKNGLGSKYYHWYIDLPLKDKIKIEIPVLEKYIDGKPQNITIENNPQAENYDASKESYINVWNGKYRFPVSKQHKYSNIEDLLNKQPHYKLVHIFNNPNYKCWEGLFEIPELNVKNQDLKKHLFNASRKWIKLGIDGFRLDVPDVLNDPHEFWKEFKKEINEEAILNGKNPDDLYIVGEIWTGERITSSFLYGDEKGKPLRFDAIMNYPVRETILNFFTGQILNKASDRVTGYGEISVQELDWNLHRNLTYVSWGVDQAQYNVFSSHDTRRIRTVFNNDNKLKAALIMQFTLPGCPTIYYGDELGMSGGDDPANRATIKWDINPDNNEFFTFYQNLISLRNNNKCLIDAPLYTVHIHNDDNIFAYARYSDDNDCTIVVVARNGFINQLNLDISGLPFENITNWKDPLSGKDYLNYGKNIIINPQNTEKSYGLVLSAVA